MPATSLDLSQIKTDALASASSFRSLIGLGTLATQSATITDYLTIASAASTYQPLDSDLTSIAALSTTAFGRGLLTEVSATTARTTLGLGTLATQSPTGTPSASTFLRGDFSWQTIDLSGYVPYSGATGAVNLGANGLTARLGTFTGATNSGTQILRVDGTGGGFTRINDNGTVSISSDVSSGTNPLTISYNNSLLWQFAFNGTFSGNTGTVLNIGAGLMHLTSSGSGASAKANINTFYDLVIAPGGIGGGSASSVVEVRNSTNAQRLNLYGTFTDASNYRRLFLSSTTAGAFTLGVEGAGTGASGNTLTLGNPVSVTGGTITASTPAINVSQTWNNAATTFTGILSNVTDTASNAASLLMDLQVGGIGSRFAVGKDGSIYGSSAFNIRTGSTPSMWFNGATTGIVVRASLGLHSTNGAGAFEWAFYSGGANICELRNSTNAQTFRIYNTFTDASNYERAKIAWESNVLRIGTEKAGTGSARALELQTDGTTRLTVTTAGRVEVGTIAASANAPLRIQVDGSGRGFIISNSATEYTEFVSGGVVKGLLCSGSVPFAVWNAGDIYFQCNNIEVLRCTSTGITASQNITLSTKNLVTDTTTGTKIGTATTQKLGFFNATPVVQPTAVADATDAASVITQLNALLSRMRDLGLIAT